MRIAWLFAAAALAACHFDTRGIGGGDGGSSTDDGGVSIDGNGNGPDAACITGCVGNDLVVCTSGAPQVTHCDLGCTGTGGGAHCETMVPSNGVPLSGLDGVTAGIDVPGGHIIIGFTDDGHIDDYDLQTMQLTQIRTATTGIDAGIGFATVGGNGVFSVDHLTVPGDGFLWFEGAAPAVVLSRAAVTINGAVDVAGGCYFGQNYVRWCNGPGGGRGAQSGTTTATGCGPGGNGVYQVGAGQETGAGGGAMAQDGADSGQAQGNKGTGGSSATCTGDTLVPLGGGGGGGAAQQGDTGQTWNQGGGGGGALQITSLVSITIASTGNTTAYIDASGAGGQHSTTNDGGGGGGAGGGVLLEAPTVSFDAAGVFAGGGGAGAGVAPPVAGGTPPTNGDGEAGAHRYGVASGGNGGGANGDTGRGGNGGIAGAGGSPATAPTSGDGGQDGTGGGGGGAGRLRVNTLPNQRTETAFVVTAFYTTGAIAVQ